MRLIEESISFWPDAVQACYRCTKCRALNLAEKNGISPRVRDESDARGHLAEGPLEWRPAGPKHYPGVPEEISAAASEAYACMSTQAYRAAILVARSVIEACAKDNGITRGRLLEKIDRMHAVALIRAHVRDAAARDQIPGQRYGARRLRGAGRGNGRQDDSPPDGRRPRGGLRIKGSSE